jgi:hypothetical protein
MRGTGVPGFNSGSAVVVARPMKDWRQRDERMRWRFPTVDEEQTDQGRARQNRRLVVLGCLRAAGTTALLLVIYSLVPGTRRSTAVTIVVFALTLVGLGLLVALQIRSILRSPYPGLRAIEVVATTVPLFLLSFSLTYLALSQADAQTFSVPLDHIRALYFTVVVFSTVGFGDIVAKTDGARLLVTVQIVLDFLLIGVVAKLVVNAVQRGLVRQGRDPGGGPRTGAG